MEIDFGIGKTVAKERVKLDEKQFRSGIVANKVNPSGVE